jgi:site-specific DNA-methyltransferase (adenine-specific)
MTYKIIQGDNRETLKTIADNTIDAIVTDPPYGIDFLGKSWDANTGALETYQECLRVLKPGGHILAFSAARTYHHLAVTLEQAGFEIRDQIMWIYSSGFPKSQDVGRQLHKKENGKPDKQRFDPAIMIKVSGDQYQHPHNGNIYRALPDINGDRLAVSHEGEKYGTVYEQVIEVDNEWSGWGTALKPAHEPIALARKPLKGSIAKNCQQWGTGALNIDATRVPMEQGDKFDIRVYKDNQNNEKRDTELTEIEYGEYSVGQPHQGGRFPSNVIGEIPDYQKYFYCPKVSRRERHMGFDTSVIPTDSSGYQGTSNGGNYLEKKQGVETLKESLTSIGGYWCDEQGKKIESESADGKLAYVPGAGVILVHGVKHEVEKYRKANNIVGANVGNNHPTVKPIELMKYLIRLITPPGGTVLDPFNGSGSTGCAAVELGFDYIGCELDPAYVEISLKRIEAWNQVEDPNDKLLATGLFEYGPQ